MQVEGLDVERKGTAIRFLISLLFWVVTEILRWVLGAIILFELGFALITQRSPSYRIRRFANQTLSYQYRILRYLTYNEPDRPFPFSEFPPEVEPCGPTHETREEGVGEAEGGNKNESQGS
jgi:hypothetical protein